MNNLEHYLRGSVCKDSDGHPFVMYHGSQSKDITVFNGGHRGIIYVTPDISYASACATNDYSEGHIYELYVNITKLATHQDPMVMQILTSVFNEYSEDEIYEAFLTGNDAYEFFENDEVIMLLKSAMYDGVMFEEEGQASIGVFYPNQLKSVKNSGAYSENSDNIYE